MPGLSSLLNLEPEQIQEMAMVDLAYRLLSEAKKSYTYVDLFRELAQLKNLSEEEVKNLIAQIYTEINLDGRFLCLGENQWGLKRWYLVETQEETAEGALRRNKYLDDDDDYDDEDEMLDEEDYEIVDIGDDLDRIAEEEDEDDSFGDDIEDVEDDEADEETEVEDEDLDMV